MAIGPHHLNKKFLEEVDSLEKTIDARLASKSITDGGSLSIDYPSSMTSQHFQVLKHRYMLAGWKDVKMQHDQREGSWLEFRS